MDAELQIERANYKVILKFSTAGWVGVPYLCTVQGSTIVRSWFFNMTSCFLTGAFIFSGIINTVGFKSVLVRKGCHSKVLWTGGLKQQKFIYSQLWSKKSEFMVLAWLAPSEVGGKGSLPGLSLWLVDNHHPPVSPCCFLSVHVCVQIFSSYKETATATAKLLQSCLTLGNPTDGSPPGSSVHGIFQARVLEWGAIAFSNKETSHIGLGSTLMTSF